MEEESLREEIIALFASFIFDLKPKLYEKLFSLFNWNFGVFIKRRSKKMKRNHLNQRWKSVTVNELKYKTKASDLEWNVSMKAFLLDI